MEKAVTDGEVRHLGGAEFIVVTEDKNFYEGVSMFTMRGKDRGKTKAEVMHRKLAKKVNSVKLVSLSEANAPLLRRVLYPTAKLYSIYRRHPQQLTKYFGVAVFHDMLLDEHRHELYDIFRSVGARLMTWKQHKMWDKTYMSPDTVQPFGGGGGGGGQGNSSSGGGGGGGGGDDEEMFTFLRDNKSWQDAVDERLSNWSDSLNVEFSYEEDHMVNDRMVDTLLEKLQVPQEKRFEVLGLQHIVPPSRTGKFSPAYRLFHPTKEVVSVSFFGREDYKDANVKVRTPFSSPIYIKPHYRPFEAQF
jgi:hypothetical protein